MRPPGQVLGLSKWNMTDEERGLMLPPLDPYDNPLLPSLRAFAEHPVSHEFLHNGASFQVRAGLGWSGQGWSG